jgi:diphosphomevalonate decarboxylase
MMSSSPAYTLMAPESLRAIKRIMKFREHHHIPLTFTLDAGPNIHLIYPKSQSKILLPFIEEHLRVLCDNEEVIFDEISLQ